MDSQRRAQIQTTYDRLAAEYARNLSDELAGKPLDRQLLDRFAADVAALGQACDLGCGPGHVARYLHERGVEVCGIDLSPQMIEQARQRNPGIEFHAGDLFALAAADGAWAGIVAFYSIVHIERAALPRAFAELRRVLRPGGPLLLAFHIGDEVICPAELWGIPVTLDWLLFPTKVVVAALADAGFTVTEVIEREPYPGVEHPSRRAYLWAR
jgi:SAM-dependent methyltransferase